MQIITQKLIKQALFNVKTKEIKQIIGRQRLKFNRQDISLYLFYIFKHSIEQKSFKSIYKRLKLVISYQAFMQNIALFSSLFKRLFYIFNKINHIKASKLLNIIDSTNITEKQTKFINQKDWTNHRVTTRIINKEKRLVWRFSASHLVFDRGGAGQYLQRLVVPHHHNLNLAIDGQAHKHH